MNWKQNYLYLLFTTAILMGCDSFQEDLAPVGEQELGLKSDISTLHNTSLFIDLKKNVNSPEAVKFQISQKPAKGEAEISDQAILKYTPHNEFIEGQDAMSVDIVNAQGRIIDTDELSITMSQSAESLGCFNGALSDNRKVRKNSSVIIYPLENDGYCPDRTSGALIDLLGDPAHGSLEQVELFTYRYIPETDFIGIDQLMYELTLTDDQGREYNSLAQIQVETFDQQDTSSFDCEIIFGTNEYFLDAPIQVNYDFAAFMEDSVCGSGSWEVTILNVSSGTATVINNGIGDLIRYQPPADTKDSIDVIAYQVDAFNTILTNSIIITFPYVGVPDTATCTINARDDNFYLPADSLPSGYEFVLDVANNDEICFENYNLSIIEQPELGEARLSSDSDLILYSSSEEFLGERTAALVYELCGNQRCDTAYVEVVIFK